MTVFHVLCALVMTVCLKLWCCSGIAGLFGARGSNYNGRP